MIKSFLLLVCMILAVLGFSQVKNPVKWSFSIKKINAATYKVHLTASIDEHWHVYSQTTPRGGTIPTSIVFAKNPLVRIEGMSKEVGDLEQKLEPVFKVDVKQFSGKVDFVQTVMVMKRVKTVINGMIEYMTCNGHECLPPSAQKFSIVIK